MLFLNAESSITEQYQYMQCKCNSHDLPHICDIKHFNVQQSFFIFIYFIYFDCFSQATFYTVFEFFIFLKFRFHRKKYQHTNNIQPLPTYQIHLHRIYSLKMCVLPPIVLSWYSWNWPFTKRSTRLDFPTADSPSSTSLNWQILFAAAAPLGLVAPPPRPAIDKDKRLLWVRRPGLG